LFCFFFLFGVATGSSKFEMFTIRVLTKRLFVRTSSCLVVSRNQSDAIATHNVTKQLTFYTIDSNTNNTPGTERPIVIVYAWLLAKTKALRTVVDYHASKGCDVLTVRTTPSQFMWPTKAQKIIDDMFDFTAQEQIAKRPIVVHAFSVGNYMYGETLLRSSRLKLESSTVPFRDRVVGQIVDSPIDFWGVPNGLALTLFPNDRARQVVMKSVFFAYLYSSYPFTMRHYSTASRAFHEIPPRAPSLWLYSKIDPFMKYDDIEKTIRKWEAIGVDSRKNCWEDSPHVMHFKRNHKEYTRLVDQFLDPIIKPHVA